jgi:HD-GYP domain-containing protein (c-di-GMP phosphodiesterase class II)
MENTDNNNEVEILQNLFAENLYQTIEVLSNVVSLQEKYYEGSHSRYVSQKSVEVGKALNVKEELLFDIEIAGLVHDIGKIGFPDSILNKHPNEMKDIERKQYELHPFFGMKILEKHKSFQNVAEIVYQHHERLDGSGFPRKLMRGEIHPGALIVSVVNTFHNLYHKNLKGINTVQIANNAVYMNITQAKYKAAYNYIYSKADIFFDQRVVDAFLENVDTERRTLGHKMVLRLLINKIEPGMFIAEDYFTSYGLLIASRGDLITEDMIKILYRFVEADELPQKILVLN